MINFKKIFNELINEGVMIPSIKFFYFSPTEILKYKDSVEFYIIRPISKCETFTIYNLIKTEWNIVYKIESIQLLNDLADFQYINTLSRDEIDNLSDISEGFKVFKFVKVVKKTVNKYFYDCEFDESKSGIKLISIGIVSEDGRELYLINKDYDWSITSKWLMKNVYPSIITAPEYFKVPYDMMAQKIMDFIKPSAENEVKLYGYYSAYDHVCICQIFGAMIDLPEGMPMYTTDLKQYIDYFGINKDELLPEQQENEHDALCDAKWNLKLFNAIKNKYGVNI